jgi:predicted aconitase
MVQLNDEERAILAGEAGQPRRRALEHQIQVAGFFDAADLVPVGQAHVMADTEALGESGVAYLEQLAACPEDQRRVRIPTLTDPRGADFGAYERIRQDKSIVDLESPSWTWSGARWRPSGRSACL